jgi:hypothetical protein
VPNESAESSEPARPGTQPPPPDAGATISPRAWLWVSILEAIGYAIAFGVGLLVLDSLVAALVGCGIVLALFVLWFVAASRRIAERAPTTLDQGEG